MTWLALVVGGALGAMVRRSESLIVSRCSPDLTGRYRYLCDQRIDCFLVAGLVGLLPTEPFMMADTPGGVLFAGVLAGFATCSTFAADLAAGKGRPRSVIILGAARGLLLGTLAVVAGWLVGTKL